MNVVTATSPVSAPAAGALPGTPAGAAPDVGPSFADVLRQLAGDTPAEFAGGRSSRAAGAGGATNQVIDAEASGDDVASASTDLTAAMGAITVPVALVLLPVTELPAAGAAGEVAGTVAMDTVPTPSAVGLAALAQNTAPTAARGIRPGAGPPAFTVAESTADGAVDGVATDQLAAQAGGPGTSIPERGAADAAAAEAPVERPGARGTALERLVGADGQAAPGTRRRGRPDTATTGLDRSNHDPSGPTGSTLTSSAAAGAKPAAPVADVLAIAQTPVAQTPVATLPTAETLAPETPAAETRVPPTAHAAATIARLLADPTREQARAFGLPRAVTRLLGGGPAPVPADASADTTVAAVPGVPAMATDLERLVAGVTGQVAPAVAAAFRGQHPALSAALRAFQQAGAAVAGGSTEDSAASVTASVSHLIAAARGAAFTGGDAEAMTPGADASPRPLTLPSLSAAIMPPLGGDLRIGSGLGPSARLDSTTLATLTPAEGDDVRAQLVQSIRVQWTGAAGEARVRLRPEHLGEVVATIKVEQGAVTATLQAERPDVRRWLEAHTQTLREGLVEHGLKLDRLVVLTEPARGETRDDPHGRGRGRHSQQPQPRPRRPRPDDSDATFELNT